MSGFPPTGSTSTDSVTSGAQKDSFAMLEIVPRLYLSKFPTEMPREITHVLNMCTHSHPFDSTRTYLHIPLDDIDNITPHVPTIIDFIDGALHAQDNNKVLVHCALGLNRSAAAILTYLCHVNQTDSSEALKVSQGTENGRGALGAISQTY